MANKILLIFLGFDILYFLCAGLHLFVPLFSRHATTQTPTLSFVASNMLLDNCPLTVSMVNSFIMFTAFLISLPAFFMKSNRLLLSIHTWLVVISALLTLVIGLDIWYSTLETKANLRPVWNTQTSFVQSMLQFKFQCCGYDSTTPFVKDTTCTSNAVAAHLGTCVAPLSTFANHFLAVVFTIFFGFAGIDVMLVLSGLCLLKDRKEQARYKLIDEKNEKRGYGFI